MRGSIIVRFEVVTDEELLEVKRKIKELLKDKEDVAIEMMTTG